MGIQTMVESGPTPQEVTPTGSENYSEDEENETRTKKREDKLRESPAAGSEDPLELIDAYVVGNNSGSVGFDEYRDLSRGDVNMAPQSQLMIREEETGRVSGTRSSGSGQKGKLKKLAKGQDAGGSSAVTRVRKGGSLARPPKHKRNETAVGSQLVKAKSSEVTDKGKGKVGQTSSPPGVVTVRDGESGSRILELHKPAAFFNKEESWAFVQSLYSPEDWVDNAKVSNLERAQRFSASCLRASLQAYDMVERAKKTDDLEKALAMVNKKAARLREKLKASEGEVRKLTSEKLTSQALAKSYEDDNKRLHASVKGREECVMEIEKLVAESKKVIADGKIELAEEGATIRKAVRRDLIDL